MTLDIYCSSQDAPEHMANFHRETESTTRLRQQLWWEMIGLPNLKTLNKNYEHGSLNVRVFVKMRFPFELTNRINLSKFVYSG